jgi:hypothetical protein
MDESVQVGRIGEINLLSATKRGPRSWAQGFNFWLLRLPPWMAEAVHVLDLGRAFKRLNFLHSAQFIDIGRFPSFGGDHPAERKTYRWMVFCGNFNQEWEPYFQAFMDMLAEGVYLAWGNSFRYPHFPEPGTGNALLRWLDDRLPATTHYYCAYPNATTHDIRAAIRVERELRSFVANHRRGSSDAELAQLSVRLQHCVTDRWRAGTTAVPEPPDVEPTPVGCTGMSGFVALLPVRSDGEAPLRRAVCALGDAEGSPFRTVPGTHFARLAVLDKFVSYEGKEIELRSTWVLFAVDFDGEFGEREFVARRMDRTAFNDYADRLYQCAELTAVWEQCYGYPAAPEAFADWLWTGVCKRFVMYRDYPDRTLSEILEALGTSDGYRAALATGSRPALRAFLGGL